LATANTDIFAKGPQRLLVGVQYWNRSTRHRRALLQRRSRRRPARSGFVSNEVAAWRTIYGLVAATRTIPGEFATDERIWPSTRPTTDRRTHGRKSNYLGVIKPEFQRGVPAPIGSWGSYFGGAHRCRPGYKEKVQRRQLHRVNPPEHGRHANQYVHFFASTWGNWNGTRSARQHAGGRIRGQGDKSRPRGRSAALTFSTSSARPLFQLRGGPGLGAVGCRVQPPLFIGRDQPPPRGLGLDAVRTTHDPAGAGTSGAVSARASSSLGTAGPTARCGCADGQGKRSDPPPTTTCSPPSGGPSPGLRSVRRPPILRRGGPQPDAFLDGRPARGIRS
jgi:hypothetical protein